MEYIHESNFVWEKQF